MKRVALFVSALSILLLSALVLNRKTEMAFTSLVEAKSRMASGGFHCIGDCADGRCSTGFFVSRAPVQWEVANIMSKTKRLGPEWKGKAWVSLDSPFWRSEVIAENAGWRTWGNVTAMGDAEFLVELEEALRNSLLP